MLCGARFCRIQSNDAREELNAKNTNWGNPFWMAYTLNRYRFIQAD